MNKEEEEGEKGKRKGKERGGGGTIALAHLLSTGMEGSGLEENLCDRPDHICYAVVSIHSSNNNRTRECYIMVSERKQRPANINVMEQMEELRVVECRQRECVTRKQNGV